MDANENYNSRAHQSENNQHPGFDVNANLLEFHVQQDITQQQALSTGQPESCGSSYSSGSPTALTPGHQQTNSQPYQPRQQNRYFQPGPIGMKHPTTSPVSPHYSQSVTDSFDAGFNFPFGFGGMPMNNINGIGGSRSNSSVLANPPISHSRHPSDQINQRASQQDALVDFTHPDFSDLMGTRLTNAPITATPQVSHVSPPHVSPPHVSPPHVSPPHVSPPHVSPTAPHPRRPRATPARQSRDEEPIGLVLVNKRKFKCIKPECKDLTFGRLADLRRHYDQQHARHRVQYFCSYSGCTRSHAPIGGKGRSFGTRKDKRDEHERNVHKKERENDRDVSYSPADESSF